MSCSDLRRESSLMTKSLQPFFFFFILPLILRYKLYFKLHNRIPDLTHFFNFSFCQTESNSWCGVKKYVPAKGKDANLRPYQKSVSCCIPLLYLRHNLHHTSICHILHPNHSNPSFAFTSFPPKSYPSDKNFLYLFNYTIRFRVIINSEAFR